MLVEMAVADAVGIAYEFVPDTADRPNDLNYYQHPTYADMVPSHYTDDTQRSLANALLILRARNDKTADRPYHPIGYLAQYQEVFRRDPRPGYSKRFEAFLHDNLNTDPVDIALKLNRKATNGAVMGSAVLGYLPTPESVMLAAAAQALSTHSYATIPYAQIVALSAHFGINQLGPVADLSAWLFHQMQGASKQIEEFLDNTALDFALPPKITMGASSAVKVMLHALPRHRSLSDLIRLAIDIGGDTDSAAAIMVAVASTFDEYTNDIPARLIDGLENGPFGRDYLAKIDSELRSLNQ